MTTPIPETPDWNVLRAGWVADPALAVGVVKKLLLQPPHRDGALSNFKPLVRRELTKSTTFKKGKVFNLHDTVAIKRDDTGDDLTHEEKIGKIMNGISGFVWTVGLVADDWIESRNSDGYSQEVPRRGTKRVQYLISEWLPGVRLFDWARGKKVQEVWHVLLQNFAILTQANRKNGFTHYDLHGGNTNIKFGETREITYPEGVLTTNATVKLFDFGRSFAIDENKQPVGTTISHLFVRPLSAPQHDIFLLLVSCFRQCAGNTWKTPSGQKLKTFFGVGDIDFTTENTKYDTRYRHFGKVLPIRFKWNAFWKMIGELEWSEECWKATVLPEEEVKVEEIPAKPTASLELRNWIALYPWQAGNSVTEWQNATRAQRAKLLSWIEQLGKLTGGAHSMKPAPDVQLKMPPLEKWTLERRQEYFKTLGDLIVVTMKEEEGREGRSRELKNLCSMLSEQLILELDEWSRLQIH
jgi:hypothetical protein